MWGGGGEPVIRSPATGKNALDQTRSPNPSSNLLSASVSPSILVQPEDLDETTEALAEYRELIVGALADFDGREVDAPGDDVVAEFPSPDNAVSCALKMQLMVDQQNADRPATNRIILAVGVHHCSDATDEQWCRGTGLGVASTLRESALRVLARTGGIFVSADVHARVRGRKELQFQDVGNWAVHGSPSRSKPTRSSQGEPSPTCLRQRLRRSPGCAMPLCSGSWAGRSWLGSCAASTSAGSRSARST